MPHALARDGTRLYYEEVGAGVPLVFVHEFGGDYRAWEPQLRYFARRYRCIAFNARGFPPSDVPSRRAKYNQTIAANDIADVASHLRLDAMHVVGCSMGGLAALHLGLREPQRVRSLTVVGVGAGSDPRTRTAFLERVRANAERLDRLGLPAAVQGLPVPPGRAAFAQKDPRGFAAYQKISEQHSAVGLANTQRGVMLARPTLQQMSARLRRFVDTPLFVIVGDEDGMCLAPSVYLKETCPAARLWVCPATGHAVNVEEPDLFNQALLQFLTLVDGGRWRPPSRAAAGKPPKKRAAAAG